MRTHFPSLRKLLLMTLVVASSSAAGQTIEPPDCYRLCEVIAAEIDLVRREMGRPSDTVPVFEIEEAQPREVYYQAQSFFRRCERLSFEHTFQRAVMPASPEVPIVPEHVYRVLEASRLEIANVRKRLRIPETIDIADFPRDETRRPTDVYESIVRLNRQTDLLLDRPFAPAETFQEVTRSVSFASRLLRHFDGPVLLPEEPEFERCKTPQEVLGRLVVCMEHLQSIADDCGLEMLRWKKPDEENFNRVVTPSDVCDFAILIRSELEYLDERVNPGLPLREIHYPGKKTPSDVYQRVGILEKQLKELSGLVKAGGRGLERTDES